jgi:hypothetical protein
MLSTQHPVAQAELKYQWHIIENGRAGTLWIIMAYMLLVPAGIASLIFFVGGLLNQFIPGGIHPLPDDTAALLGGLGATLLIAMNLAMYLVLTMITLALASNSIGREKRGKTWENLLLTGVDARQIVWGKWWATLAAMWGDHAAAALLRLGIVAWGVAVLGGEALYQPIIPFLPTMLSYLVAGALLLVGYAVVDAALTAALGLLIPLTRFDNAAALVVVMAARLLLTLTPFVVPYFIFTQFENHFASFYVGFWTMFLVVLALLTWGVLRLAQWQAVRQNANPPLNTKLKNFTIRSTLL